MEYYAQFWAPHFKRNVDIVFKGVKMHLYEGRLEGLGLVWRTEGWGHMITVLKYVKDCHKDGGKLFPLATEGKTTAMSWK